MILANTILPYQQLCSGLDMSVSFYCATHMQRIYAFKDVCNCYDTIPVHMSIRLSQASVLSDQLTTWSGSHCLVMPKDSNLSS